MIEIGSIVAGRRRRGAVGGKDDGVVDMFIALLTVMVSWV